MVKNRTVQLLKVFYHFYMLFARTPEEQSDKKSRKSCCLRTDLSAIPQYIFTVPSRQYDIIKFETFDQMRGSGENEEKVYDLLSDVHHLNDFTSEQYFSRGRDEPGCHDKLD